MEMMSPTVGKIALALSKAQHEIEGAVKNSDNPFFKSKYAGMDSFIEACRGPLHKNELAISQMPSVGEEGRTVLVTLLLHSSGEWLKSITPVIQSKPDIQGLGSALTYTRRYAYGAIVGISSVDDDGEEAMKGERNKPALLNKPEKAHSMIKEPSVMNRFFCFETCEGDLREYLIEQSKKQSREIPEMVQSINESEDRYKMFWKAYTTWKAKRALPASPTL